MSQPPHEAYGDEAARRSADPSTSHGELFELASTRPDLRPAIAENPNTYPDLITWLGTLGDPQIDAALARRFGGSDPSAQPTQVYPGDQPGSAQQEPLQEQPTQAMPKHDGDAPSAGTPDQDQTESFGAAADPGASGPTAADTQAWDQQQSWDQQPAQQGYPQPGYAQQQYEAPQGYYPGHDPYAQQYGYQQGYAQQGHYVQGDGQQPVEEETGRKRGSGGCIAIVLLILLTLGALVAAFLVFFGNPFADDDADGEDAAIQDEPEDESAGETAPPEQETELASPSPTEETEAPSPTPTEEEDEEEDEDEEQDPERPAPSGAQNISGFSAPSENIHCEFDEDAVTCTINEFDFSSPAGCGDSDVTLRVSGDGEAEVDCGTTVSSQGVTLNYGSAGTNDDFACISGEGGIECWSTLTGNGFELARESFDTYDW